MHLGGQSYALQWHTWTSQRYLLRRLESCLPGAIYLCEDNYTQMQEIQCGDGQVKASLRRMHYNTLSCLAKAL